MNALRMYSMAFTGSGRLSVPVKAVQAVYAQYKHVYGQTARAGQRPLALTRLRYIDRYMASFKPQNSSPSISFSFGKTPSRSVQQYKNVATCLPAKHHGFRSQRKGLK